MATDVRFKDFSSDATPVTFKIDNDTFTAPASLPIPTMQALVRVGKGMKNLSDADDSVFDHFLELFDAILVEQSAALFRERVGSKKNPISVTQVINILHWLLEVYGLRPTEPSSDSSSGLPTETDGTLSTAGVSLETSTP